MGGSKEPNDRCLALFFEILFGPSKKIRGGSKGKNDWTHRY
jgi:hypothetical protein